MKNTAISNIKIQHILSSLSLSHAGIYLRDGPFTFDVGIVNLHPTKTMHASLEVYSSVFKITKEIKKFELHTNLFDEFSITESKDELEEILGLSDITFKHLQNEMIGPRIFKAFKKLASEKTQSDGYIILLMGYGRSPFQNFLGLYLVYMKMIIN